MGRLSGFTASDITHKLRRAGFAFDRSAKGSHEIWRNLTTGRRAIVPNHPSEMSEGTVRAIVRQSGLTVDEFLKL